MSLSSVGDIDLSTHNNGDRIAMAQARLGRSNFAADDEGWTISHNNHCHVLLPIDSRTTDTSCSHGRNI
jgi:hypothetical protein